MNFYLKNVRTGEIEHVGKIVRGWCFQLNHDTFWNDLTKSYDLSKLYSDRYKIYYSGEPFNPNTVYNIITQRSETSTPIHEDALPGPRGLARRKIGTKINSVATCVAHPEDLSLGYDIIKGDFQL